MFKSVSRIDRSPEVVVASGSAFEAAPSELDAEGACDPRFRSVLERVGARAFDESRDVVYGLWPDLRLAYYNASWARPTGA